MKVRSWLQVAVPLGVPPFCDSHARQSNGENQEGLLQSSRNELRAEHIFVTAQNARNKSRNRERGGEEPDADIPPELACLCRRRRGIHTSILTALVSERKPWSAYHANIESQVGRRRGNATSRSGAMKDIHATRRAVVLATGTKPMTVLSSADIAVLRDLSAAKLNPRLGQRRSR